MYDTFNNNPNEVAYLFGLILGDGHLKKIPSCRTTTRVSIAFDKKYQPLINTFESVGNTLKIHYFVEPKIHDNCQMIGFSMPDDILKKYNMLWNGAKYNSQPHPSTKIVRNINFASGLINSDGHIRKKYKNNKSIHFYNTVKTIVSAYTECLDKNNIYYTINKRKGKIDKRNGNQWKDGWLVNILRKEDVKNICLSSNFILKGLE